MFDKRDALLNQQHIHQTRRAAQRHQLAQELPRNAFPAVATIALILGSIVRLFR